MENNRFVIHNDEDLREGIKKWYCIFDKKPQDIVFIEFQVIHDLKKVERLSANGFNNLLIVLCALKRRNPDTRIFVQLFTSDILEKIINENDNKSVRGGVKQLLIFFESLNLIEMLLKIGVVLRPSDEVLRKLVTELSAIKEERKGVYSSKILCLNPLINNSQEQYNLTYRMKTLMNILYWQLRERIDFKELKEASGQIMFELVKNIYQHSEINNDSDINGFTCAQINSYPIIKLQDDKEEKKYTESLFLTLSQNNEDFFLNDKNMGAFISITVNDFGIGIHKKVLEKKHCASKAEAIIQAFTTNFSSKILENIEYWKYNTESEGIPLEHKGYGLLYCLLFVFKNLGRIKIYSGGIEVNMFTKIEAWANHLRCYTPVDFVNLLNKKEKGYEDFFDIEIKESDCDEFVGTQILIEIPTNNMYRRGW